MARWKAFVSRPDGTRRRRCAPPARRRHPGAGCWLPAGMQRARWPIPCAVRQPALQLRPCRIQCARLYPIAPLLALLLPRLRRLHDAHTRPLPEGGLFHPTIKGRLVPVRPGLGAWRNFQAQAWTTADNQMLAGSQQLCRTRVELRRFILLPRAGGSVAGRGIQPTPKPTLNQWLRRYNPNKSTGYEMRV